MRPLYLREVFLWQTVADVEICVFGEEAEVPQRIHLRPLEFFCRAATGSVSLLVRVATLQSDKSIENMGQI